MSTYQPYTYLIAWSDPGLHYYGVRYATNCHPGDLWTTYFTSSTLVQRARLFFGEPDIIQIRKTFDDKDAAIEWEHKVLRRMRVMESANWLNRHIGKAPRFHPSHREAMSKARIGYKFGDKTKKKLSDIRRNEWKDPDIRARRSVNNHTPEGRERIAEYQRGQTRSEEHKSTIREMRQAEWADPEKTAARKKAISDAVKAKWADPEYRARMMARRSNNG